jgi:uncharacterized alkaline shock family protein YloU
MSEPSATRQNPSQPESTRGTPSRSMPSAESLAQNAMVPAGADIVIGTEAVRLESEHGRTIIAQGIVAKIAGVAAREVEGVHDLVPLGAGATIVGFAGKLTRADQRTSGVSVEVGRREAAVDLNVTVDYGVNIPQVAEAVRQNIMDRVHAMTGLTVKEVNINAADLYFPEEQAQTRVQ